MHLSLSTLPIITQNHVKRHFILPEITLHREYDRIQKKVMMYRLVFVFLGILFACLSATLYFQNPNWVLHHVFLKGILIKDSLTGFSTILSIVSLWFGCHTRTSIELAKTYTKEAISRIKLAYNEMRDQLSHQNYQIALNEIEKMYKETLHHLDKIHGLSSLSDTTRRKIKMTHLKNLKDELEKIKITL